MPKPAAWEDDPRGHIEALGCHCCSPTAPTAPSDHTPHDPLAAYETPTLNSIQFSSWARAIALETAASAEPATLGEHIDLLILKLRAVADGDEPLRLDYIPGEV